MPKYTKTKTSVKSHIPRFFWRLICFRGNCRDRCGLYKPCHFGPRIPDWPKPRRPKKK